ncbi:MAG: glycosyltransferase [Rhizobiaceae bacterium]
MKISVIIAAYDKPRHLERVLHGYLHQTDDNFEVIVTEDGQSPRLADIVRDVCSRTNLSVTHLSQEDKGFRKTTALNRGITAATGEYLIFTDDDCVPRKDIVSTHRRYAKNGRYIVGAYNRLPLPVSKKITIESIHNQKAFRLWWLILQGYFPTRGFIRILAPRWLGTLLDLRGPLQRGRFPGGHASCFKTNAEDVGGFNENMAYGLEDREFGVRLCNSGLVGKRVKNSTFMLHLEHERPYRNMEEFDANKKILDETITSGRIVSAHLENSDK